jgi:hypothetical protein
VVTTRRIALLASAVSLAGCEVYAVPDPVTCPGTSAGVLEFNGTIRPSSCAFAGSANATLVFTGTVSFEPDGRAWLCIDTPHAEPRQGTHAGDAIDVSYRNVASTLAECNCPVDVLETVAGSLVRGDGGRLQGFTGAMTSAVAPTSPDAGSTPDGGLCGCQLPCALEYDLTAQAIEPR